MNAFTWLRILIFFLIDIYVPFQHRNGLRYQAIELLYPKPVKLWRTHSDSLNIHMLDVLYKEHPELVISPTKYHGV